MTTKRLHPPLTSALGALALLLWLAPTGAVAADRVVSANEPVILSNDITNHTTAVVSFEAGGDDGDAPANNDAPKGNNGHGNNDDGVDSSNPGNGGGGPNGAVDESCSGSGPCVDDESNGGGKSKKK